MDLRAWCRACGALVAVSITGGLVQGHDHDVVIRPHPDHQREPGTYEPGETPSVHAGEPAEEYLLLENGDRLMLEDGSGFLLLESSPQPGSRRIHLPGKDDEGALDVVLPPEDSE
jgi:hypothetical protein